MSDETNKAQVKKKTLKESTVEKSIEKIEPETKKTLAGENASKEVTGQFKRSSKRGFGGAPKQEFDKGAWQPRTALGKKVKSGEIKDIAEILDNGWSILEAEIIEVLLPDYETDLLMVGQSKGKFGGGKRSVFKQTQKKTREGNKPHFSALAVVGNKDGFIGLGHGSSRETVPSREKALRTAKLNMIKIRRGSGSWESDSRIPSSVPFAVTGKCSGVTITLLPAPKGTGLCIEPNCGKLLELAGIKDVHSTTGRRSTKLNLIKACFNALKQLTQIKVFDEDRVRLGIIEGRLKTEDVPDVIPDPAVEEAEAGAKTEAKAND